MSVQRTITLVEESEGWTAIDEATGMECSGEDRCQVLARLDDAVAVSFEDDAGDGEGADGATDGSGDEIGSLFAGPDEESDAGGSGDGGSNDGIDAGGSVDEWFED